MCFDIDLLTKTPDERQPTAAQTTLRCLVSASTCVLLALIYEKYKINCRLEVPTVTHTVTQTVTRLDLRVLLALIDEKDKLNCRLEVVVVGPARPLLVVVKRRSS